MVISNSPVSTTQLSPKGALQQTQSDEANVILREAMFSLEWKNFSRGKSDNVLVKLSYRGGDVRKNEMGIVLADYTKRTGVVHKAIILPEKHPTWATDAHKLWNEAIKCETRVNSVEAREIRVTVPKGLLLSAVEVLGNRFGNRMVQEHGCAIEMFIHKDKDLDYNGQIKNEGGYHIHFVLTTRRLTEAGFTEKIREMSVQKAGYLPFWRQQWQDFANQALAENGRTERIDCRSYRARGLAKEPTKPMLPSEVRRNRHAAEALRRESAAAAKPIVATA